MNAEQARRVADDARATVHDELMRAAAAKAADAAMAAEQQARIEAAVDPATRPTAIFDVNEQISHRGAKAAAMDMVHIAEAEATHGRAMELVCEEVTRVVNRKAAIAATAAEAQRRTAEAWMREVTHELRRAYNVKIADAAAAAEQATRINDPAKPPAAVSDIKHDVNRDIERIGSITTAKEQREIARSEMAHERFMEALCEEMRRTVARNTAKAAADAEQTRQMAAAWMFEVAAEVRSTVGRANAMEAEAYEQQLRTTPGSYWQKDPRTIADAKREINTAILRRGGVAEAATAVAVAQAEQIHERKLEAVCEEVRRTVAQRKARMVTELEQAQRIAVEHMHAVADELRREHSRKAAASATAAEQQARTESGVLRTYWVVDAPTITDGKAAINGDIEKMGRRVQAREDAEVARAEQVHEHNMAAVCEAVRRAVAQTHADRASEIEKAQRIALDKLHTIADDLRRTVAQKAARAAAADEQQARVESGVRRTYWVVDPPTISEAKAAVNADIERRGLRAQVVEEMEAERAERMKLDALASVAHEVRRFVAQKTADAAMEMEAAKATTRKAFEAVAYQLVGEIHRRDARDACTVEQKDRVTNPTPPPPDFARMYSDVLGSVRGAAASA